MKTRTYFFSVYFISLLILSVFSCKEKAKEAKTGNVEKVAVSEVETEKFIASPEHSSIIWQGFKPGGSHNGTITISNGSLDIKDGKIIGGEFTIDMNSIINLDLPADSKGNAKLIGHLKSADFFDVENFPEATFKITRAEQTEDDILLSGNLTIKEKTNNISFPVSLGIKENYLVLISDSFTIDRSKWDIKHKSKSFFSDLGDKFINDEIEINIAVRAAK